METVTARAKRIIADTLGVDECSVTPDADLQKDLGADSLDVVELVMILEKNFKVSIPDEMIEKMKKVKHVTDYLEKVKPIPLEVLSSLRAA